MLADILQTPDNLGFGIFLGCLVALIAIVALVLTVVAQIKAIFFAKEIPEDKRPVTEAEFERRLGELKHDLMAEINRPNLAYVTQQQLETKLDRLEIAMSKKIDDGGAYAHQREHTINNNLQMLQNEITRISLQLGLKPVQRRGPIDTATEIVG